MIPQQYPEPAEPIRAIHVGDTIVLPLDTAEVLVSSQSEPDVWHVVINGRCSCTGFRYREQCRHLGIVQAALQLERG